MSAHSKPLSLLDGTILKSAALAAFVKMNPLKLWRNPVMFATELAAIYVLILFVRDFATGAPTAAFAGQIGFWLTLTAWFATFAEGVAEGRGKAQAASLRRARSELTARRIVNGVAQPLIAASDLGLDDCVEVAAGEYVPADGEVVEGVATVDESAITGESAPVIREAGGDRSAVTAGTRVLSDRIVVRVTARQGDTFLDRMIALVEGASRRKTPNEIALGVLLAGLSLIFVLAVATIPAFAGYSNAAVNAVALASLFVALIPTTIGGLLSAIGIAGMDRLVRFNVLATSGRAVEAAGDVDVLLLDKTGTITLGDRQAVAFLPSPGIEERELADAAQLASLSDETPEGRSIVVLAKERFGIRGRVLAHAKFFPFSAQTRMSGVDAEGAVIRKGAVDAVIAHVRNRPDAVIVPKEVKSAAATVAKEGGTPLAVARDGRVLGIVHLKDVVKGGVRERFAELRRMGIRTVMITGDNPLTAAAIAAEAGVDDFLAEAKPEDKLALIRSEQAAGRMVAMCGDGTNDAPALAQADVGVAMQSGTPAAREAGNMVDLDSDPTKLIEVVSIGKQLLMTRGSLTTFSIANDVAKYFAIIPAMFLMVYPGLQALNIMRLASPESAILSAIIFNALVIPALIPLALRGVKWRAAPAAQLLSRNLAIYGVGGLVTPFIGIKLIDFVVSSVGLA
ncbi:MAG: potassium-transporting ATPase subunit KdpB [Alphaproteobacteria bacterium]|nr:potassium-transporting ATPase subunit KdpB [Alphaproteobacteria bacterium]